MLASEGDWEKRLRRSLPASPTVVQGKTNMFPLERTVEHMSRLHQSDGLSILARYTSVAAFAVAASALPVKSAANEQPRDDQVKVEASEDGRTATGDRSALD
jgi:hypothetical protein